MSDTGRDRSPLLCVLSAVVLGTLAFPDSRVQAAETARPASKDEVQSLCQGIAHQQEVEHLDQMVDLESCVRSAMVVRTVESGAEMSGRVVINFPGYTFTETCRASLRAGQVDPKTIDCR